MSGHPNAGAIVVGIFLALCGVALTFLGGGCTILLAGYLLGWSRTDLGVDTRAGTMLLASLPTLAIGLLCLWGSFVILRGGARRNGGPPERGDGE